MNQTITRNRDSWRRDLERLTGDLAGEHGAAILHLERIRARLIDAVTTASWLVHHPTPRSVPEVHQIPQPPEYAGQPPRI